MKCLFFKEIIRGVFPLLSFWFELATFSIRKWIQFSIFAFEQAYRNAVSPFSSTKSKLASFWIKALAISLFLLSKAIISAVFSSLFWTSISVFFSSNILQMRREFWLILLLATIIKAVFFVWMNAYFFLLRCLIVLIVYLTDTIPYFYVIAFALQHFFFFKLFIIQTLFFEI